MTDKDKIIEQCKFYKAGQNNKYVNGAHETSFSYFEMIAIEDFGLRELKEVVSACCALLSKWCPYTYMSDIPLYLDSYPDYKDEMEKIYL